MGDVFPPEKRRQVMSRIRSRGTKPELEIKRILDEMGVEYVYQARVELEGRRRTVDFLIPDRRLVIEYRSCFWHSHMCKFGRIPKNNQDFWLPKLIRNKRRDFAIDYRLWREGYIVRVIWDCDLGNGRGFDRVVKAALFGRPKWLDPSFSERKLGFILGFVVGDGSISKSILLRGKKFSTYYRVCLYTSRRELADTLTRIVNEMGFGVYWRNDACEKFFPESGRKAMSIVLQGHALSYFLYMLASDLKMPEHYFVVPSLKDVSKEFVEGFLVGLFLAEGSIVGGEGTPQLRIYSSKRENLEQVQQLLDELGIESRVYRFKGGKEYYLAILKDSDKEHFCSFIDRFVVDLEGVKDA